MISTFNQLREQYALQEIEMHDLKTIQQSAIVSFENRGISRTHKASMVCEITFDAYIQLKKVLLRRPMHTIASFCKSVEASGIGLIRQESDENMLIYSAEGFEVIATISSDGMVHVEEEDIEGTESFSVYIPVQKS